MRETNGLQKLMYWLLSALLTIVVAIAGYVVRDFSERLTRIERTELQIERSHESILSWMRMISKMNGWPLPTVSAPSQQERKLVEPNADEGAIASEKR